MSWPAKSLKVLAVAVILIASGGVAADDVALSTGAQQVNEYLREAAAESGVPLELLQAIAFVESRWEPRIADVEREPRGREERDLPLKAGHDAADDHSEEPRPPAAYGVMGLRDDPHFGYSLRDAAALIGRTPDELKEDARLNIRGAAALLSKLAGDARPKTLEEWEDAVAAYSGIPEPTIAEMYTYDVFNAIRLGRSGETFRVHQREISLEAIYGHKRLGVLSAPRLTIDVPAQPKKKDDINVRPLSDDYGPAIWDAAPSCNYTAGRSEAITHVAIHIVDGSYAGAISWFNNCDSNVSAHYVIRSSDGQVTQMVREHDTAYHVRYHNSYTIGIEHEGYASNCAWYTTALYNSSANLVRDISASRAIAKNGTYDASQGWDTELPRSSVYRIKGHTNFPATKSCPGGCWDWWRYRGLVVGCQVQGAIKDKYYSLGGPASFLRECTTNELTCPDGVGKFNHFAGHGGSIYWTPDTGAHVIYGSIRKKWADLGWETGFLKYPTTDELGCPDGVGRFNHFQGGSIYWTPDTGAQSVQGAIKAKWAKLGWETGFLRYPTTDETGTPDGIGRFNHFQGGSIYWTANTGAWSVQGAIRSKWASMGWETSCLGYPTSDEFDWNGGRRSNFQKGYIYWTSTAGAKAYCN